MIVNPSIVVTELLGMIPSLTPPPRRDISLALLSYSDPLLWHMHCLLSLSTTTLFVVGLANMLPAEAVFIINHKTKPTKS